MFFVKHLNVSVSSTSHPSSVYFLGSFGDQQDDDLDFDDLLDLPPRKRPVARGSLAAYTGNGIEGTLGNPYPPALFVPYT